MKKMLRIGGILIISGLLAASANAATVEVVNDNKKELEVIFGPGEGTVLPSKWDVKYILKHGEKKKVEISHDLFPEDNTFSVLGKVSMPSIYNRCGPMLIDRNYVVVFTATAAGATACHYSEAKK
ncbi:MAG: hypothetical protein LW825_03690 [Candidatus Jidaibacter sp.]|jgi:hypothetical protein|nr:hypothetical protein [Candidatus Jidaibacter sp.]